MIAQAPARRVRHLRLAAPDEASARRGALLLEDALHTATLPDGDAGRLIVVQSLALGRIDSRGSAASMALALERSWRLLAASAVHAEAPSAPHTAAVYFRDRAEALVLLAGRLAAGRNTGAWFWPLAVPGWRAELGTDDALRAVLAAALDGAAPAAAVLSLAAALLAAGALPALLAALRPGDGPRLLAALGLADGAPWPLAPHTGEPAGQPLAAPLAHLPLAQAWPPILAHWTRAWGAEDARSTWLVALALAVDAPARLLDPGLLGRAGRLTASLAQSEPSPAGAQAPAASHEPAAGTFPTAEAAAAAGRASPPSRAAQAEPPPGPAPAPPASATHADGIAEHTARPAARRAPEPGQPAPGSQVAPATRPQGTPQPAAQPTPKLAPQPTPQIAAHPAPELAPLPMSEASYTHFAGLALALPLLSRLGIAGAIAADPMLADLDLPGRLLAALARAARIPADDPIRAIFAGPHRLRPHCSFTAPAVWRTELAKPGPLAVRAIAGRPGMRILCEAGGRLPLALWHGEMPAALAEALGGAAAGPPLPSRSDAAVLVDAWQIAARRWLAAHAGLTLNQLIRRPGCIALTRTHLDVSFALREADIRVRRAGLDLDPGWLAWYGRVVLFHYVQMPWDTA